MQGQVVWKKHQQKGVHSSDQRESVEHSVPCTTLRIHPNISEFWVFLSSTGSMTEEGRALINGEPETRGSFGVRMEGTASGQPRRTRCHSVSGLRGLDSPPSSPLRPLYMHRVTTQPCTLRHMGHREHPFVSMRAHTDPDHTWMLLEKHIHRHARSLELIPEAFPAKVLFVPAQGRGK